MWPSTQDPSQPSSRARERAQCRAIVNSRRGAAQAAVRRCPHVGPWTFTWRPARHSPRPSGFSTCTTWGPRGPVFLPVHTGHTHEEADERDFTCRASSPSRRPATSASWPTSTRARRRRPSGSSTTPAAPTRWARSTRARPRWTGWSRSRSAGSRSPPPPPPASGPTIGSTSSTRRVTSTSRSRSSARCACSTAPWRCSTPSPASSRSRRPSGARPTSTRSRASPTSTRWTASARTSSAASRR